MSDVQADVDLDLYADVEGGEFGHEAGYDDTLGIGTPVTTETPVLATGSGSSLDLFGEEALAVPSATHDFPVEIKPNGAGPSPPNHPPIIDLHLSSNYAGKKVPCYVGNLQWWTTDQDLTDAIVSLGIADLIEIKFYENKVNGQSKGFAVVTVGSDTSFRNLMEKLNKKELHGQTPMVTYFSKHNLNQFEAQARKDMPGAPGASDQMPQGPNPMGRGRQMPPGGLVPGLPLTRPGTGPGILPRPGGLPGAPGPYQQGMIPAPGAPQVNRPMMQVQRAPLGMQQVRPPPGITGMVPRSGAPGMVPNLNGQGLIRQPPPQGQHRMPQVGGAPPPRQDQWAQERQYQQQRVVQAMNQPFGGMGAAPGSNGLYPNPPNPHQHHGHPLHAHHPHEQTNAPVGYFSRPHERQEAMFGGGPSAGGLSEDEIQGTLEKNRSISSSALTKAVTDAASGDLRSAIETLSKAISLISKSVMGSDERSRFLIGPLQDALKGFEDKQYQRQTSSRDRDRDRDHHRSARSTSRDSRERARRSRSRDSRDRDSNRRRDKHRHRSRSRDRRDYYEDSRSYHRSRH